MQLLKTKDLRLKTTQGFTLVELLVVITIIGILSSLGFSSYTQYQKRARDASRKFDIKSLQAALEAYNSDQPTQGYPQGSWSAIEPALKNGMIKYLKVMPKDPLSTQATTINYFYQGQGTCANGLCSSYLLCAKLENTNDSEKNGCPADATNYNYHATP